MCGYDVSKDLGSPCVGDGSYGEVESTSSLFLFMEAYELEVEEELSTLATQYRAEGVWTGKWHHEQREAWMR